MKIKKISFIIITLLLLGCSSSDWQYLGQKPPGESPEIFAPGIISGTGRLHTFPAISQDGKQILWMTIPPKIMEVHYEKGKWSKPKAFEPLDSIPCLRPGFDKNGILYFSSSNLPGNHGSLDLWYLNKHNEPINLGKPINSNMIETAQSFTDNGDIYFTSYVQDKKWDRGIVMSRFIDGKYEAPRPLPESINTPDENTIDYLSFISPDGTYILFSSNRLNTNAESCRIFISFKDKNDNWGEAINLSEMIGYNLDSRDPALSPDGKYLFFSSGSNIMWVDAAVIDKCRKK